MYRIKSTIGRIRRGVHRREFIANSLNCPWRNKPLRNGDARAVRNGSIGVVFRAFSAVCRHCPVWNYLQTEDDQTHTICNECALRNECRCGPLYAAISLLRSFQRSLHPKIERGQRDSSHPTRRINCSIMKWKQKANESHVASEAQKTKAKLHYGYSKFALKMFRTFRTRDVSSAKRKARRRFVY